MNFLIEHPTRGILVDIEWDGDRWWPRWSWSKPRTEARPFARLIDVQEALARLPEKQRREASIRRWGTWEVVS